MKRGIAFTIDPSTSKQTLWIKIEEIQGEGKDLKWIGGNRKLYKEVLLQMAKGTEIPALNVLFEEKKRHLRKLGRRDSEDTVDFSLIPVERESSIPVLKALAPTGKLYFKRQELIPNFFSRADLHYVIENCKGSCFLRCKIKHSTKEFDLNACDLIFQGQPCWLIHKGNLLLLKEATSWNWMQKVFHETPLKLSAEDAEELTDLVDPSNITGSPSNIGSLDPLPILQLTDSRGGFANLFMDYDGQKVSRDDPSYKPRKKDTELSWKRDLIEAGYQEKQVAQSHFYCPLDKVSETLLLLLQIGWKVLDCRGNQIVCHADMGMDMEMDKEYVCVIGKVKFGNHDVNISAVVKAVKRKESFLPLKPGFVGLLTKDFSDKKFAALIEGEILNDQIRVHKYEVSGLTDLFQSDIKFNLAESLKRYQEEIKDIEALPTIPLGKSFQGKLRGYQEQGVAWLSFLHKQGLHGILADDMGLGKTVQVLAFLSTFEWNKPALIVMPKSLLFHWKNECARFLPSQRIIINHGGERFKPNDQTNQDVIILTSYGTLKRDIELLAELSFSCVILDEAQAIKNAETQIAKAVCRLRSDFRLSMTGTPIENHMGEILSQFDFLIPELFKDQASLDPQKIKHKVRPFILRRKKADVDEQLPEKIEQTIWLEMEEDQRNAYDNFLASLRSGLLTKVNLEGKGKHRMEIFEAILRLRQICCHPTLLNGLTDVPAGSIKLDALLEDLTTVIAEGQKAIVFSQFTKMLKLIAKEIHEKGWKFTYLDGDTKDREARVDQFQNDPQTQLFLISLKAGGVGMNLTAADYVFLYDPWWNEAVENQAIDRAHRIGRRHTVIAKRYLIRDSIEDRMMQLKQSKQALTMELLDGPSEGLNDADLEFLLH